MKVTAREARYGGWSPQAISLVERACARHGGWARYERLDEISARVVELAGPLPTAKGSGRTYPPPGVVRVEPHRQRTTFVDWPEAGSEGRFDAGDVRIVRSGGSVVESLSHRERMSALRWQPLDTLYFFGYALANYWALPFLLASTRFVRADARRVTVEFPDGFDTHSPRQSFEFDDGGLLIRHDYVACVVGPWAAGAHFTSDYEDAGGLCFARTRRVTARLGSLVTSIPVLHARIERFEVRYSGTE